MANNDILLVGILGIAAFFFLRPSPDTPDDPSGASSSNNTNTYIEKTGYEQFTDYKWLPPPSRDDPAYNQPRPAALPTPAAISVASRNPENTPAEIQHGINTYAGVPAVVSAAAYYNTPKAAQPVSYLKDAPKSTTTAFQKKHADTRMKLTTYNSDTGKTSVSYT